MLTVLLFACTTIRAVAPGAAPGELYLVADYGLFGLRDLPYVVRCEEVPDNEAGQEMVRCYRYVGAEELEQLNPRMGSGAPVVYTRKVGRPQQ